MRKVVNHLICCHAFRYNENLTLRGIGLTPRLENWLEHIIGCFIFLECVHDERQNLCDTFKSMNYCLLTLECPYLFLWVSEANPSFMMSPVYLREAFPTSSSLWLASELLWY